MVDSAGREWEAASRMCPARERVSAEETRGQSDGLELTTSPAVYNEVRPARQ